MVDLFCDMPVSLTECMWPVKGVRVTPRSRSLHLPDFNQCTILPLKMQPTPAIDERNKFPPCHPSLCLSLLNHLRREVCCSRATCEAGTPQRLMPRSGSDWPTSMGTSTSFSCSGTRRTITRLQLSSPRPPSRPANLVSFPSPLVALLLCGRLVVRTCCNRWRSGSCLHLLLFA